MKRSELETRLAPALTSDELDRRLDELPRQLFDDLVEADAASAAEWIPVPISSAEFVRRMRPFLTNN